VADYANLNSALEEQLNRTAGFVRAAFHVRSIDSHDWGKEADPQPTTATNTPAATVKNATSTHSPTRACNSSA
jgi:hypothetical protein